MATVLIETRRLISAVEEQEIMDAVHRALHAAFKLPANDRTIRFMAYEPHRFAAAPDLTHPELFTLVTVDAFTGRSVAAKRILYQRIVDNGVRRRFRL